MDEGDSDLENSRPKNPSKEYLKQEAKRLKELKKEEERIRKSDLQLQKEIEKEDAKYRNESGRAPERRREETPPRKAEAKEEKKNAQRETPTPNIYSPSQIRPVEKQTPKKSAKLDVDHDFDDLLGEKDSIIVEYPPRSPVKEKKREEPKPKPSPKPSPKPAPAVKEKPKKEPPQPKPAPAPKEKPKAVASTPKPVPAPKESPAPKPAPVKKEKPKVQPPSQKSSSSVNAEQKYISPALTTPPSGRFILAVEIKATTMHFTESFKAKFTITNISGDKSLDSKLLYRILLIGPDKTEYLLGIGMKSFNNITKIGVKGSFSAAIPPVEHFKYRILLYQQQKEVACFDTQDITVTFEKAEKLVNFQDVTFYSPVIIPENSFVFWLHYSTRPLPLAQDLHVEAVIEAKNERIAEHTYSFQVQGIDKNQFINKAYTLQIDSEAIEYRLKFKQPFLIQIPTFKDRSMRAKLIVTVKDAERNIVFTRTGPLLGLSDLQGIKFTKIGYKQDIKIGEPAYMLADLQNKTSNRIKGKAVFSFFTPLSGEINAFTRKFTVDPQNYEKVSEDIYLPEFLAGKTYWVICKMSVKTKQGTYLLESLSAPFKAPIPQPKTFIVKMQTAIDEREIYWNSVIAVGLDVRVRTGGRIKELVCEVFENYENIEERLLKRFKIKDFDGDHQSFHWKAPARYGHIWIDARLLINGIPADGGNIEKKSVQIDLSPKPKGDS